VSQSFISLIPENVAWLEIAIRLVATAVLVVAATWAAERSGPLIGALIATLPISAGPAYIFVALEHDAAFVATAALASLAINAATLAFCLAYVLTAQARSLVLSYGAALVSWVVVSFAVQSLDWSLASAIVLNVIATAGALVMARRFATHSMPVARRRWYDVPFRTAIVATFVSAVVAISAHVGPAITGMLAVFPIVLSSLIVILQPRVGGPAAASLIAHGMFGTIGFATALIVLHVAAPRFGSAFALSTALCVCVGWNLLLLFLRRAR
jgi:hypothetical protein